MNKYELTVILRNNEVDALKIKTREMITKYGAVITEDAPWGNRRLAYEIAGEKEGYYDFMLLDAPPESIDSIIGEFRLNIDIRRHMFGKLESEKTS